MTYTNIGVWMFQKGSHVENARSRMSREDPGSRVPPVGPESRVLRVGPVSLVSDEVSRVPLFRYAWKLFLLKSAFAKHFIVDVW